MLAFLLIAALLGAASLRALFALESLTTQSRESAASALELSAAAQSLTERSVSMERASRQAIVLDDRLLRQRFNAEAKDAAAVLDRMAGQGVLPSAAAIAGLTNDVLGMVEFTCKEGLRWFIHAGIASRVDVTALWTGEGPDRLASHW